MLRLFDGSFDASNPDLTLLAGQYEKPAGIYIWALHARGIFHGGVPLVMEKLNTPLYRDVNIYARVVTPEGLRFVQGTGFTPVATFEGRFAPHLHMMPRATAARINTISSSAPLYDGYRGRTNEKNGLSVTIARSLDDIM